MTDHQRSFRVIIDESVGGAGTPIDCTLHGHAHSTVRELIEVGAARGLWPRPREPWLAAARHSGRRAESDEPVALLGLVQGDDLDIQAADRTIAGDASLGPRTHTHELAVISGPASGQRVPLGGGTLTVGRGEDCDLSFADPSMSLQHFRLEPQAMGWAVVDVGSGNGTSIDGVLVRTGVPALLADGAEVEAGRTVFALRLAADPTPIASTLASGGEVAVVRAPRAAPPSLDESVDGPAVPSRPRGLRGSRGGFRQEVEQLWEDARTLESWVAAELLRERADRLDRYPDAAEVARRAIDGDRRLWERRPDHLDHCALRLGIADQPSQLRVRYPLRGDPELRAELLERVPPRRVVLNAPAVIELAEVGVLGVVGPRATRSALTRWLVIQLAALHSPRELGMAAILDEREAAGWEWLKWLPHLREATVRPLGAPSVATREAQVSELLDAMAGRQRERIADPSQPPGADLVLLVDGAAALGGAAMKGVAADASRSGVQVIWVAGDRHELPDACRVIVEIDDTRAVARITDTETEEVLSDVSIDGITPALAVELATHLAPLRDATDAENDAASPETGSPTAGAGAAATTSVEPFRLVAPAAAGA